MYLFTYRYRIYIINCTRAANAADNTHIALLSTRRFVSTVNCQILLIISL